MRYLAYVVLPLLSLSLGAQTSLSSFTPPAVPADAFLHACYRQAEYNYDVCQYYCTRPGALLGCAANCKDIYQAHLAACRAAHKHK